MIPLLDNAESTPDPQGTDAREIYSAVQESTRFSNICLIITSSVSAVPSHCRRLVLPTLLRKAACNIFHDIYDNGGRSDLTNNLAQHLDYHTLSITLLATAASHNMWIFNELAKKWDAHCARVTTTRA